MPGLFQPDDIGRGGFGYVSPGYSAQEAWRDVPLATVVGDDCYGSFVVARKNALNQAMAA